MEVYRVCSLALNLSYLARISDRTWQYRVKLKEWKLGVNGGRVGHRMKRIVGGSQMKTITIAVISAWDERLVSFSGVWIPHLKGCRNASRWIVFRRWKGIMEILEYLNQKNQLGRSGEWVIWNLISCSNRIKNTPNYAEFCSPYAQISRCQSVNTMTATH